MAFERDAAPLIGATNDSMESVARPGLDERDLRFARLREAMRTAQLDALLVAGKGHWWTGRGYWRYLTDFHLWGHDGLILLPLESEPVFTLSSYAVAERVAARGWITDGMGDVYIAPRIADAIRDKRLAEARIGIAGDRFILGAGTARDLRAALPGAQLSPADDLIDHVRAIKSPLEITQNRALWRMAKAAMERFREIVEPGVRQLEIAAEITKPLWAAGARDILILMGEDPQAMNPPTDERLRCDDKVRFHLEICGPSGHWCEITINCAIREPKASEAKLIEDELAAFDRLRSAAKPGQRLSELAAIFDAELGARDWGLGAPTTHFDFHGQGMDTIERPWFSAAPGWGASQDWTLEAGMVFSYHPRRTVHPNPGWSSGINEDILITAEGAERLAGDREHRWRQLPGSTS